MIRAQIKGWHFPHQRAKLAADGSTTLDNLRAEKTRLESRLAQIPGLISNLQHSIQVLQQDITWLGSLNNRRKKNWEKENGKSVEKAMYDGTNILVGYKAQVTNLENEKARIPEQIKAVDRQLEAMIQGESQGLSRGLDSKTARELGEMEVLKEQQKIEHEAKVQEIELQKVQEPKPSVFTTKNILIGLGAFIALGLIVYFVFFRKKTPVATPSGTSGPKLPGKIHAR